MKKKEEAKIDLKDILTDLKGQTEDIEKIVDEQKKSEAAMQDMLSERVTDDTKGTEEYPSKTRNLIKSIAGHSQGISKMIENGKNTDDVLMQVAAVKKMMSKLTVQVYANHIEKMLETASSEESKSKLEELLVLLKRYL